MLVVSAKQIFFSENEETKFLTALNSSQRKLIYKIKINNMDSLAISPGKGYLRPQEKCIINIQQRTKNKNFDAKLLIMYAATQNSSGESFESEWSIFKKEDFTTQIILISRKIIRQLQDSQKNIPKSHSIYSESEEDERLQPNLMSLSRSGQFYQTADGFSKNQSNYRSKQVKELEQKWQEQKSQNEQLLKQLQLARQKLRGHSQVRQNYINRSTSETCEQNHFSISNILLISVICFILGFILAKVQ